MAEAVQGNRKKALRVKRFDLLFLVCFTLIVCLAGTVLRLKESGSTGPGVREFPSGWQTLEEAPGLRVLQNRIPPGIHGDAALFIPPYGIFQSFEVIVENQCIYGSGVLAPDFINRHLYLKWHLIPLGPLAGGKKIVLRVHSGHHRYTGLISKVYTGTGRDLLSAFVLRDLDITVLAFLFIIAGAAALVVVVTDWAGRKDATVMFSTLAASAGLYILTESRLTQLFIPITPIQSYLHYICFFTFAIGMAGFVETITGPGFMGGIRRTRQVLFLVLVSGTLLDLLSLVPWDITMISGMWLILVLSLPLGAELIRSAAAGNYAARVICLGFGMVLGFGVVDLMGGLRIFHLENQAVFPWALLLLMFNFLWVLVHIYKTDRETYLQAMHSEQEAVAEERRRIARDIHDGLAQDLAVMNMKAGLWRHLMEKDPKKMAGEITWLEENLSKSIRDVRRCIFALRPADLEKHGLIESLNRMIREFENRQEMRISFDHTETETLPRHLEPVVYRIFQEALNNTAKHARATEASVRLEVDRQSRDLCLEVSDNGRGFVLNTLDSCYRNGHLGLKQLRERVEQERGTLCIRTAPDRGTTLTATLPMARS